MNAIELEAQKNNLVRAVLGVNDEDTIRSISSFLSTYKPDTSVSQQKKRNIGFLEGKAKVIFHDEWSMTPEELGMV